VPSQHMTHCLKGDVVMVHAVSFKILGDLSFFEWAFKIWYGE